MAEIAIIGAGVIGCSVALELARRGHAPTVIDRNGAAGHGSTSASCGIVRRFYSTETMTAMAHEGATIWAEWSDYLGLPDDGTLARFERPGMLFIPPRLDDGVHAIVAHMRALGVEVEVLSADDVERRFPFLDASGQSPVRSPRDPDFFDATERRIEGAVFEADAGYVVSPQVATANLHEAALREGVTFRLGRTVLAITRREPRGFTLQLDDGTEFDTAALLNAAGPHSALINDLVGARLPIETRALRREVHAVENPTWSAAHGSPLPIVGDVDSGVYFRPESGGRDIIVGSLDPACDELEWFDDPDACNPSCTNEAFERQVMRTMKRVPELRLPRVRGAVGLYDVSLLDWHPILDSTDVPGYYVAIGTSGSSFKTAPVIGRLMAELIGACEGGHDHDRDPVQVALPHTGFTVDASFFSRNRGARRSSGTVLA